MRLSILVFFLSQLCKIPAQSSNQADTLDNFTGIITFGVGYKKTYDLKFTCKKESRTHKTIFRYSYQDTTYYFGSDSLKTKRDSIQLSYSPQVYSFNKKDLTLSLNGFKLKFCGYGADSINQLECFRFMLDIEHSIDEEMMYYFSPEHGILYSYSVAWANSVFYKFSTGQLKDFSINFKDIPRKQIDKRKGKY